jgi:transcriptional regulator with XRE-family HTH domain
MAGSSARRKRATPRPVATPVSPREREKVSREVKKRIGRTFQEIRLALDLTQSQVAERAGLCLKYYGEIERGEVNGTTDALGRIAYALGWQSWTFFSNDPAPISENLHRVLVSLFDTALRANQAIFDVLKALDRGSPATSQLSDVRLPKQYSLQPPEIVRQLTGIAQGSGSA